VIDILIVLKDVEYVT